MAPAALPALRATPDPSATVSPSIAFPVVAGYTIYLAPPLSRWGEDGFSRCSTCPHHRAVPPTPPKGSEASVRLPPAMLPSSRTKGLGLRIVFFSRPLVGSLALRPGDSLTIPKMALSGGFLRFVSSPEAPQATGVLTGPPVGLSPTEQASLTWTHWCARTPCVFSLGCQSFLFESESKGRIRDPELCYSYPQGRAVNLNPALFVFRNRVNR